MNRFGDAYFIIYAHHRQRRGGYASAYRRNHEPLAGLPSGVPPPERARQRVGLKVDWLLRSTVWFFLQGSDLRPAPPRPFGLRPSASRSDTNRASARHEHLRFSFDPSFASLRQERSWMMQLRIVGRPQRTGEDRRKSNLLPLLLSYGNKTVRSYGTKWKVKR